VSLPVHAGWSELLLFSPGSSCIALQLQIFGQLLPQHVGNSVLNTALCPTQLWDPALALLWEVGLSPHPCSQPLLLGLCLFSSFPYSLSPGQVQYSTLASAIDVRLQFALYTIPFGWGRVQSAHGMHWILFPGGG
jgi:hypothetical protein